MANSQTSYFWSQIERKKTQSNEKIEQLENKITRYSQKIGKHFPSPVIPSTNIAFSLFSPTVNAKQLAKEFIKQTPSTTEYRSSINFFLLYVETDTWNSEWALGPAKSVNKLVSKLEKGASKWCQKLNYKSVWYQTTNIYIYIGT